MSEEEQVREALRRSMADRGGADGLRARRRERFG